MATTLDLVHAKKLHKLDPGLEWNEQEWRYCYLLPRCQTRLDQELSGWTSQWKVEETPLQQFDSFFEVFCSGEILTFYKHFKPLNHLGDGVWELKTPDLRIFGWFHVKDCFVAGNIDTAFNVKNHNLYAGYAGEVARDRNQLDLDNPKFVPGEDPNVVVSNYDFPQQKSGW